MTTVTTVPVAEQLIGIATEAFMSNISIVLAVSGAMVSFLVGFWGLAQMFQSLRGGGLRINESLAGHDGSERGVYRLDDGSFTRWDGREWHYKGKDYDGVTVN